ncbi:MAG: VOC family protein [Nitrospirota bacterium]
MSQVIDDAEDKEVLALLLRVIPAIPIPLLMVPSVMVQVDETSLDYLDADGDITPQHDPFLVSDNHLDRNFERIRERRLPYRADPHRIDLNNIDTGRRDADRTLTIRTDIYSKPLPLLMAVEGSCG